MDRRRILGEIRRHLRQERLRLEGLLTHAEGRKPGDPYYSIEVESPTILLEEVMAKQKALEGGPERFDEICRIATALSRVRMRQNHDPLKWSGPSERIALVDSALRAYVAVHDVTA